jgi:sortase A
MKSKKTGIILDILIVICLLAGSGFLLYPTVGDVINAGKNKKEIDAYSAAVEALSEEEKNTILSKAQAYNTAHTANVITDAFTEEGQVDETYEKLLDVTGDGMMGYLDIPKINVHLAIYHGTANDVLQNGVGHLEGTSLPIGGTGTHAVLAGHRGLPSARLFTDLDQIETGDIFSLRILDEELIYEVDQIKVVEPYETEDLAIDPQQDYVTLVTCTPYGVNTQRLLIRGHRLENTGKTEESSVSLLKQLINVRSVIGVCLIVILIIVFIQMGRKGIKKHE